MEQTIPIGHHIVIQDLEDSLGFHCFDLQSIPCHITSKLREKKITIAREMLLWIEATKKDGRKHIVRTDNS
jgi:hypothetical protein